MWPIYILIAMGVLSTCGVLLFVIDMLRYAFTGKTFLLRKDNGKH